MCIRDRLTNGVKILAKLDEATEKGITLSYEEKQAIEGKKKKQLVDVYKRQEPHEARQHHGRHHHPHRGQHDAGPDDGLDLLEGGIHT